MHGSSSVPQDLQDIINKFGGKMPQTYGVPIEEIQRGIKNGVRKINIDTDNRMAITGQIRKVFQEHPEEFDPRKYLKPAQEAMIKVCKARFEEFNTAGQASKIKKVIPLAEMAKRYASRRTRSEVRLSVCQRPSLWRSREIARAGDWRPPPRSSLPIASRASERTPHGAAREGPPAVSSTRPYRREKFGFPQVSAGAHRSSANSRVLDGWICLEFLGFSRPK